MKFYKCDICGKIVAMVKETPVDTMCCGQAMRELVPASIPLRVCRSGSSGRNVGSLPHFSFSVKHETG